jgi:hypothetical protein
MIRFWCECGRQLQAREEHIGQLAACPVCKKTTRVPDHDQSPPDEERRGDEVTERRPRPRRDERDEPDDFTDEPRRPRRRRREGREPVAEGTSGLATAAMICGILSLCGLGLLAGIPAIILGIMALRGISQSEGRLAGNGSAIAGLVLGAFSLIITGLAVALLFPAVGRVREASARLQEQNNLKFVAIAIQNYHDVYGTYPAATAFWTRDGKPGLSWRVAILPFIEQDALYKQFRLDEPWDSPHNIALLPQIPKTYLMPGQKNDGTGMTHYQVFVGPGTMFEPQKRPPPPAGAPQPGMRIADILDGTSNTIMLAVAASPVPWTKPDDMPFVPNGPLPQLDRRFRGGFNIALADGSTRWIPGDTSENILRLMITRNDGQVFQMP